MASESGSSKGTEPQKVVIENESRLRAIFDHASVGFAISELDGQFIEVNPKFCEMTGYTETELHRMKAVDIIHTADLQKDGEMLTSLLSGAVSNFIIEKRFIKKDGSVAWIKTSVSLVPNQQGRKLVIRVVEDITAVKVSERARKESEAKFSVLAESMPIMVWTTTPDGQADYFNQTYFNYTGSTYEENYGTRWGQFLHPEDLESAKSRWLRSIETGSDYYAEFRIKGKNGLYRWVAARAVPLKDKNNRIQKWYGTNADIHDVKALSQELESAHLQLESEKQKFETIFADSATSMAVLQGPRFIYENANPSYLRLFNNRTLLGRPFLEALPELRGQQFPEQAKKVFETGEAYIEIEAEAHLMRTDQGPLEARYFDQSYTRMLDGAGNPYGVFIHAIEVTDRVIARRNFEETSERFRIAVEAANMGTWEVIPQTGVVEWSARASELFGVEKPERLHLSEAKSNIHPDDIDRVNAAIAAATDPSGTGDYQIDYRTLKPDGQVRWLSLLGKSFFAETPEGRIATRFSGTALDVTDRMTAEVELRDAKERAELASAAKSSFLANMSHEIRTPLGAIMGFVSLIKDETLNPQTLLQYVSVIERNSVQLMRIIDDILDLSKVEAGMMLIEHVNFSLVELLSDFSSLMGFRAREKGILFELRAKTELPAIINSDPTRIRQILTNIVGNAIKFTESGSVVLNVFYRDQQLEFEVIDTGRGISADQSERLFQPFSQADASTTRRYGGTGLGLVLTRRLSEAMGGTFELVTSEIGKGSVFRSIISIQLIEGTQFVRALGFASEVIRNAGIQGELGGLKILLVEDSPDNQALFSIYLSRAGASIDIAPDGLAGVEMASKGDYDLILMDVQMPVMDGITAVKMLRSKGYAKPVMALTAHAMKEEKIRCLEAGYTGFLSKPIQRGELIDALKPFKRSNQ